MTLLNVVTAAWFIATVAPPVPAMRFGVSQEPRAPKGIEDQFTIALPEGWSVYDQTEAVFGKASGLGMVAFSAQRMTKPGDTTASREVLAKVDSGEIASFFDGLDLLEPGLTAPHLWWPDGPRLAHTPPAATKPAALASPQRKHPGGPSDETRTGKALRNSTAKTDDESRMRANLHVRFEEGEGHSAQAWHAVLRHRRGNPDTRFAVT